MNLPEIETPRTCETCASGKELLIPLNSTHVLRQPVSLCTDERSPRHYFWNFTKATCEFWALRDESLHARPDLKRVPEDKLPGLLRKRSRKLIIPR